MSEQGPKRHCDRCGCRLSRYNTSTTCSSCARTGIQPTSVPEVAPHVWQDTLVRQALAAGDFGSAFLRIREVAALRQSDLAAITGLSQSFVSLLEAGTRRLTHIDKITSVLGRLEVPPDILLPLPHSDRFQGRPRLPQQQALESSLLVWEDPLDIAQRLNATTASNIDTTTLELLRHQIADIVDRYEAEGPHQLADTALKLRTFLQDRLDGRQPPRQRHALFQLAAQASGLLGYMAVNSGLEAIAEAYCTESFTLAQEIDDQELMMWALGTRSLAAYYASRYDEALQWASAGIEINSRHPQAIRLLVNGRARALGKLGDTAGVERAVAAAENLCTDHPLPEGITPCIAFTPYSVARTLANAATAHLALGNTQHVLSYANQIDDLVEQSDSAWSQALVRLDVATALLTEPNPDVEHAMTLGRRVLEAGGGPPIRSVIQRASDLHARAEQWREVPAVREYGELLLAWRAEPLTRAVAESAKMTGL